MATRYFNPYTDFGFKKLFGEEGSKELLIDFLNQLLPPHHQIAQLSFKNSESLPDTYGERKAIFDLYCESNLGQQFIVEMQKAKLKYFVDRSIFYVTYPVRSQSEKGSWDFKLLPIYFIAILDFLYDEQHEVKKFKRGFEIAELSQLSSAQYEQYQKSLLQYIEIRSALDTAREEGREEGLEEGMQKGRVQGLEEGLEKGLEKGKRMIAALLKKNGMSIDSIAQVTGLSEAELSALS